MSKLRITPENGEVVKDNTKETASYRQKDSAYENETFTEEQQFAKHENKQNGSNLHYGSSKKSPPAYDDISTHGDHTKVDVKLQNDQEIEMKEMAKDGIVGEYEDDSDEEDEEQGCFGKTVVRIQSNTSYFWEDHSTQIKYLVASIFVLGYAVYFGYAMSYEFGSESSIRLLWMTLFGVFLVIVTILKENFGDDLNEHVVQPLVGLINRHYTVFKIVFFLAVLIGLFILLTVEVAMKYPYNLISFLGYVVFLSLIFIFSANPSKVYWRPVLWGVGLQFVFALLVLRTAWGYNSFKWLGDRIQEFMAYTDEGSIFVFGESYEDHFFAFKVMPVVVFLSCVISVLYYLGIMQIVILKLAWVMQRTMGTSASESVNAAGNIFIGQTEAPLLIRPMIDHMTDSELHAVMVGGFATIAGSVLATYILFGVPANHLVTASVMAAPCALGMSKLSYPEVKRKKLKPGEDVAVMDVPPYANVIEAASAGASAAIPLVANIVVNIIAFIALVEFFNTTLTWMGHRVGLWPPEYPELTFEFICSYLLWPFAFLMGVAQEDCRQVAELIGIKTFVNEMVAYTELGVLIDNSETFNEHVANNGTYEQINDDIYLTGTNTTLYGGVLQDRSIVIATYALCGFANVASIGTVMGALGGMAPQKAQSISRMTVRAMITGTIVSFMNACVAGLLYNPDLG